MYDNCLGENKLISECVSEKAHDSLFLFSKLNMIFFPDLRLHRFTLKTYWYYYSFPFHLPYKINHHVRIREFLGLICVVTAVAGISIIIIIIIINFVF
jgi:hypothetical protein